MTILQNNVCSICVILVEEHKIVNYDNPSEQYACSICVILVEEHKIVNYDNPSEQCVQYLCDIS